MSNTYPDLTSKFPDSPDNYIFFSDVTASTRPIVQQYYSYIESGNFISANQLLIDNPVLNRIIISAKTFQTIHDGLLALQRFVTEDVFVDKVNAIVKDKGNWNATTQYQFLNIVYYNGKAYMVSNNAGLVPPVGTLPTDITYYRQITIVGASGTGMAFHESWSSTHSYELEDSVPYGNKLYVCVQANINKIPSESPDHWKPVVAAPKQIIISQNQPTSQEQGDIWLESNLNNNLVKFKVNNGDGTYSQKYVDNPNKADLVDGVVPVEQLPKMNYEPVGAVDAHNDATDVHRNYIKTNVLPDDVCGALGIDRDTSEPKDALALIADKAQFVTGSYTGTGTSGSSNPIALNLGFRPSLLLVMAENDNGRWGMLFRNCTVCRSLDGMLTTTWSDTGVSWYSTTIAAQLNTVGKLFRYMAFR